MEVENSVRLEGNQYATPKRKVFGDLSNGSPVSPMANLKLLTKVATSSVQLESNDCSSEFRLECRETELNFPVAIRKQYSEVGYMRRAKSLSCLCEKFLSLFPLDLREEKSRSISIKHIAVELGVEKRRVYDIINIIECLDMARKFAKDSYIWYGNRHLSAKVHSLYKYAFSVGMDRLVNEVVKGKDISNDVKLMSFCMDERRLGVLCQKFVMLLLICHNKFPVTLDMATAMLISGCSETNKTKNRRLYDISNMLLALGVISRIKGVSSYNSTKKPAFVYCGPSVFIGCKCTSCIAVERDDVSLLESASCQTEINVPTYKYSVTDNGDFSSSSCSRSIDNCEFKEPVAKKRLVFSHSMNLVFKPIEKHIIHKRFDLKTCKPLKKVILQHPTMKIEVGSEYRAVKVGTAVKLVKIL